MLFNFLLGMWCDKCKNYKNPHIEIYLDVLYEGSITCDKDHLIGNDSDLQWQEYWKEQKEN
jgi:hypothetical protein